MRVPPGQEEHVTDDRLGSLIDEALEALDADDVEKAMEILDVAWAAARHDPRVLELRAEALVLSEREDEAEEMLAQAVKAKGNDPTVLLVAAAFRLDRAVGDPEELEAVAGLAEKGEKLARLAGDLATAGELLRVKGRARGEDGDFKGSVGALEQARELLGDDVDLLVELGIAYFQVLRLDDARRVLEGAGQQDPDDADVQHYLGLVAERRGDRDAAEKHFERARRLDPDAYPKPWEVSDDEFTKVVEEALAQVPAEVRQALKDVPILVEDLPADHDLTQDPPLSPLSVGMIRGDWLATRGVLDGPPTQPTTILLFKRNLERYAPDRATLVAEIEQTLFHEIGHFVGWDEDDLFERGLD